MTSNDWGTESTICRRHDLEWVEIDGELIVWDPTANRVHRLDRVASLLWEHLDGTPLGELCLDVSEAFGVPTDQALNGLLQLAEQLQTAGLLVDC
jgi:hypothetical protein